jgi:hypothetical protein
VNAGAFAFGVVVGLFIAAAMMLATLARYVQTDLEGFQRWLDRQPST